MSEGPVVKQGEWFTLVNMYKLSCSYRCKWMWFEEKEKIQKSEENKNYCMKIYQFIKLARSFLIEHFSWAGKSNFCWWFHIHWWLNLWSMSEDGCDFVFYLYHLIHSLFTFLFQRSLYDIYFLIWYSCHQCEVSIAHCKW